MATTARTGVRRPRAEWRRLVAAWRRSGKTAAAFASEHGLTAGTLRWWGSRLGREDSLEATSGREEGLSMVRVRVVDAEGAASGAASGAAPWSPPSLAWTLRTSRGELDVYAGNGDDELRAVVVALLGARS